MPRLWMDPFASLLHMPAGLREEEGKPGLQWEWTRTLPEERGTIIGDIHRQTRQPRNVNRLKQTTLTRNIRFVHWPAPPFTEQLRCAITFFYQIKTKLISTCSFNSMIYTP